MADDIPPDVNPPDLMQAWVEHGGGDYGPLMDGTVRGLEPDPQATQEKSPPTKPPWVHPYRTAPACSRYVRFCVRSEVEECDDALVAVGVQASGVGDVDVTSSAERAYDDISERGEVRGSVSGAGLVRVLVERDVTDVVEWSSHCSLTVWGGLEQAVLGGWQLDTQAFSASGADVDGAEFSTLDTLQHRLA